MNAERGANPNRGTADFQRNDAFAALGGFERQMPKLLAVAERLDGEFDHSRGVILDTVVDDLQHIDIGFVADRNELGEPNTKPLQRAHEAAEQRAAVRDDRHRSGRDRIGMRGVVAERKPRRRVVDAVGIRTEQPHPSAARDRRSIVLAFAPLGRTNLSKTARPDDCAAHAAFGAGRKRRHGLARRHDQHRAIDLIGKLSDGAQARVSRDLAPRRIDGIDQARKPGTDQVCNNGVTQLSRRT